MAGLDTKVTEWGSSGCGSVSDRLPSRLATVRSNERNSGAIRKNGRVKSPYCNMCRWTFRPGTISPTTPIRIGV